MDLTALPRRPLRSEIEDDEDVEPVQVRELRAVVLVVLAIVMWVAVEMRGLALARLCQPIRPGPRRLRGKAVRVPGEQLARGDRVGELADAVEEPRVG